MEKLNFNQLIISTEIALLNYEPISIIKQYENDFSEK